MLKAFTLTEIAVITAGQLQPASAAELSISAVSKDTRTLEKGQLYVALSGDNFDGHQFLHGAQEQGAQAAIVEQFDATCSLPQITVANSVAALAALAGANRKLFTGPVVAITGSAGKTTTKQLTQAVLSQQFNTLMTQGNLNNHIGAPLTGLAIDESHQAAVIELGASGAGEIAVNAQWLQPNVAIITNAVEAHLAGFGSLAGVVQTKGELLDYVSAGGTAVLNADDEYSATWIKRAAAQGVSNILLFGLAEHADVRATDIECSLQGSRFELSYRGQRQWVNLPLLGEHNVVNALAAAAAGFALSLSMAQVVAALENAAAVQGRLQKLTGANGQTLFDDAYNANPTSVKAAIDVLQLAASNWLVLGDMAELGANEVAEHQAVGAYAKTQGIQHLLATGPLSKHAVSAFGEGAQWFATREQLADFLQENTQNNDVILVKGSRSAGMERIVEQLQQTIKVH